MDDLSDLEPLEPFKLTDEQWQQLEEAMKQPPRILPNLAKLLRGIQERDNDDSA